MQVDFAFIDVEAMDVECLEGMKETIKRSPNLVIGTEWSGYSAIYTRDVYLVHLKDILEWFKTINYKFYQPATDSNYIRQMDCKKNETFLELSLQQALDMT